jgi:lipopolysaccharide biosynthesis protein
VESDEVARLRQRVIDLEYIVAEYQNQTSSILSSASWKVTRPLRASTRVVRTAQYRARLARTRLRSRRRSDPVVLEGLLPSPVRPLRSVAPQRLQLPVASVDGLPAEAPLTMSGATVLVLAHVHYPELWRDISDRLVRIPMEYDLVVTVTRGAAESAIPSITRHHPNAQILVVPNRGRDWGPALEAVRAGLVSGYDAVVKVHTKKSEHRVDGSGWRLELLDGVLESPAHVQRIVDLLKTDPSVAVVAPARNIAGAESWGSDLGIVSMLAETLPMPVAADDVKFPAGSMFWCRPWLLERLLDFGVTRDHFELEGGQLDGTMAHALERMIGVLSHAAGADVIDTAAVGKRLRSVPKADHSPKVLSFYYPQFHQSPENDRFWGVGFTDWVNVRKAKPLFSGHRQPVTPHSTFGQYDLSEATVLKVQTDLAREHGIDGFVFHYYWFDGHQVLDKPLQNLLNDPSIDMPFALNWANEPWTRRWDGLDNEVLLSQEYKPGWEERFFQDVLPAMRDPRYLTVQGLPLLMAYRLGEIPEAAAALKTLRNLAVDAGLGGLHVIAVNPSRHQRPFGPDVLQAIDGICSFPPGNGVNPVSIRKHVSVQSTDLRGDVYTYDLAFDFSSPYTDPVPHHPGVFPGWDNTPRRGENAHVFHGSNPATWRKHFAGAMRRASQDGTMVFVNSWNEWAEGACLEPSERFGTAFLRTVHEVKSFYSGPR